MPNFPGVDFPTLLLCVSIHNTIFVIKVMMENSVKMMLMDVKRYLVLRDNNVLTMLHH